jgi:hypothetical protein
MPESEKTGGFMPPIHILYGRCCVEKEGEVLGAVHADLSKGGS